MTNPNDPQNSGTKIREFVSDGIGSNQIDSILENLDLSSISQPLVVTKTPVNSQTLSATSVEPQRDLVEIRGVLKTAEATYVNNYDPKGFDSTPEDGLATGGPDKERILTMAGIGPDKNK